MISSIFFKYAIALIPLFSMKGSLSEQEKNENNPPPLTAESPINRADLTASSRYGPDGDLFLDPYILPYLENFQGKMILDAGCGPNPYGIHAAKFGAKVVAIDIQPKLAEVAANASKRMGVQDRVCVEIGDVSEISYPDRTFDSVLSINVGSYLPSTIEIEMLNGQKKVTGLGPHMKEVARVLKDDGTAVFVAPASLAVVFSDHDDNKAVIEEIKGVLGDIGSNDDLSTIKNQLKKLNGVYRATFVHRGGQLVLVTDESNLQEGETIWRKIPGSAISHRYHSEAEYLKAIVDAGLVIQKIERPHFFNETARVAQNNRDNPSTKLGKEYLNHHPFVIVYLKKPST